MLASALALGACADGIVTEEETPLDPVFTVQADAVGALTIEGEPRGALAWTVYDPAITDCLADIEVDGPLNFELDSEWEIGAALQRCFFFSERGRVETDSVAIEAAFPAQFEIDVQTLPSEDYLSGAPGARIGFSDVYVYVDNNGNNAFDETPRGAVLHVDKLIGTSRPLSNDDEEYSFMVYREGDLSPIWKLFTAIYACEDPAPGFSTVTLSNLSDLQPTCVVDDRPVPVRLYDDGAAQFLACAPDPQSTTLSRPLESDPLPAGTFMQCGDGDFGRSLFTTDEIESVCPTVREYSLVGCSDFSSEDACRSTFWNIENNEPSWWPCGRFDALFFAGASTDLATDGIDTLMTVTWGEGVGQIPFEALRVEGNFTPDGEITVLTMEDFDITDNDDNGVFNRGDSFTVSEPSNLFTAQSTPGSYVFSLYSDVYVEGFESGEALRAVAYVPVPLPEVPRIEITAVDAAAPVQVGASDIAEVTYASATGLAFPIETVTGGALIGGELPVTFLNDGVRLINDVNGDGAFGPGDTLMLQDTTEGFYNDITPDEVGNFGNLLYIDLRAEYAYNTVGYIAYTTIEVQ